VRLSLRLFSGQRQIGLAGYNLTMSDANAVLETDCRTVKAALNAGDPLVLLDCREQSEYELVRIDSARLVPMSELQQRVAELDDIRAARIVVYCHHGVRSRQVAKWLRGQGFANVQSLAGGIDRWSKEIDPALPRY
jgi:rhodanese-related sulfurtransferase